MKSFTEFIKEENEETYELFLEDEIRNYKYDEFNPSILEIAIEHIIEHNIHYRGIGQEWWDWYLYETLNKTFDTEKLINYIDKKFKKYKISIDKQDFDSEYYQFFIKTDQAKELANNEDFISLCDRANYEIIINKNGLTIKPIKGKDITEDVYKYDKIYHVTAKFIYENNIKDFGISPKGKSVQKPFGSKYKRIYCYYAKDPIKGAKIFAGLKKRYAMIDYADNEELLNKYKEGYVLLIIDLKKYKERQIKFFEDSGQKGLNAFWTYDFIPYWCIENIEDLNI